MIELLNQLFTTEKISIQEALLPVDEAFEYWHSTILDVDKNSISAGFGKDRLKARKVAIAEYLERSAFRNIYKSENDRKDWGINIIPTGCGFAVGFDKSNAVERSIQEAVERWVMSQWIDDLYSMEKLDSNMVMETLDRATKFFLEAFDEVHFYKKEVVISLGIQIYKVTVQVVFGLKDSGIYPGSMTTRKDSLPWQHAAVESFRHFLAIKNNPTFKDIYPEKKVLFFSKNAKIALSRIDKTYRTDWKIPQIIFHKSNEYNDGHYFLARTIVGGWKSWNEGPIERFLY